MFGCFSWRSASKQAIFDSLTRIAHWTTLGFPFFPFFSWGCSSKCELEHTQQNFDPKDSWLVRNLLRAFGTQPILQQKSFVQKLFQRKSFISSRTWMEMVPLNSNPKGFSDEFIHATAGSCFPKDPWEEPSPAVDPFRLHRYEGSRKVVQELLAAIFSCLSSCFFVTHDFFLETNHLSISSLARRGRLVQLLRCSWTPSTCRRPQLLPRAFHRSPVSIMFWVDCNLTEMCCWQCIERKKQQNPYQNSRLFCRGL